MIPQTTWIGTFVEGVTDKHTGLPLFSEFSWFEYKVSGVMCSESVCEYYWSIEGWIHSQRRNRLDEKLVEKLVLTHTNLVLRESYSTLLNLLRVKTRVYSYNLYGTPFLSYPSYLTLVTLIID